MASGRGDSASIRQDRMCAYMPGDDDAALSLPPVAPRDGYDATAHTARACTTMEKSVKRHGTTLLPASTVFAMALRHRVDAVALRRSVEALVRRHGVLLPLRHQTECYNTSPLRAARAAAGAGAGAGADGAAPGATANAGGATLPEPSARCSCVAAALDYQEVAAEDGDVDALSPQRVREWVNAIVRRPWDSGSDTTLRVRVLTAPVASATSTPVPRAPEADDSASGTQYTSEHVLVIAAPCALVDTGSMGILLQDLVALCVCHVARPGVACVGVQRHCACWATWRDIPPIEWCVMGDNDACGVPCVCCVPCARVRRYKTAHFDASIALPHLEMDFLDFTLWQEELLAVRRARRCGVTL